MFSSDARRKNSHATDVKAADKQSSVCSLAAIVRDEKICKSMENIEEPRDVEIALRYSKNMLYPITKHNAPLL